MWSMYEYLFSQTSTIENASLFFYELTRSNIFIIWMFMYVSLSKPHPSHP